MYPHIIEYYCPCNNYFTVCSLQFIGFIVSPIKWTIVRSRNAIAYVYVEGIKFS